jgi:ABC-type uncharacterized transport system permease subunit
MKNWTFPLRLTSGLVVYIALWCAMFPIVRVLDDVASQFERESLIAAVLALVAFLTLWWLVFRRFTAWCDAGVSK